MLKRLAGFCAVILALMFGGQIASAQSVDEIIKKGELVVGIDLHVVCIDIFVAERRCEIGGRSTLPNCQKSVLRLQRERCGSSPFVDCVLAIHEQCFASRRSKT